MEREIIWEGPAEKWPCLGEFENYKTIIQAFDPKKWIKLEKKGNKYFLNCNNETCQ